MEAVGSQCMMCHRTGGAFACRSGDRDDLVRVELTVGNFDFCGYSDALINCGLDKRILPWSRHSRINDEKIYIHKNARTVMPKSKRETCLIAQIGQRCAQFLFRGLIIQNDPCPLTEPPPNRPRPMTRACLLLKV